jgi:hypothetical protein
MFLKTFFFDLQKEKDEWDGSIDYLSQTVLKMFRETFFISDLSKQIM